MAKEFSLDYRLSTDEIKEGVRARNPETDFQFCNAIELEEDQKLDIVSLRGLLFDEDEDLVGDKGIIDDSQPFYIPMIIDNHDVLLAMVPTTNGLQPFYVDSLGAREKNDRRLLEATKVVALLKNMIPNVLDLEDISVAQQHAEACGLAVISNIENISKAAAEEREVESQILYQGENREKFFQNLGDDLYKRGVLPDSQGKKRDFQQEFFIKLGMAIQEGKSVKEIKTLIDNDRTGLDIKRVLVGHENFDHTSLLESALIGGNFEVFKWLVEEKGLSIAEGVSGMHLKFNSGKPEDKPEVASGAKEILRYIDSKVDSQTKSKINLMMLAAFYMDVDLCEKLRKDPEIDINLMGRRAVSAVSISTSNKEPESQQISKALLADPRINVKDSFVLSMLANEGKFAQAKNFLRNFANQLTQNEVVRHDEGVENGGLKALIGVLANKPIDPENRADAEKLFVSLLAAANISDDRLNYLGNYDIGGNPDFTNNIYKKYGQLYVQLSDQERAYTQELIKSKQGFVFEFVDIVTDKKKLDAFVKQLDADPNLRKQYNDMKSGGNYFPLNIIDAKYQEIIAERGFFARVAKYISEFIFSAPVTEMSEISRHFAKVESKESEVTVDGEYRKAHRRIIEESNQENVNYNLQELKKLKDTYDSTLVEIKRANDMIDSSEKLRELNVKFFEILGNLHTANQDSLNKIREVRSEVFKAAYGEVISEKMAGLQFKLPPEQVVHIQKAIHNTYKIIATNKRLQLQPEEKTRQLKTLYENIDKVLKQPKPNLKENIAIITELPLSNKKAKKTQLAKTSPVRGA
jgi:hypothetical protein